MVILVMRMMLVMRMKTIKRVDSHRYWRGVKAGVQQGLRIAESRVRIRETENDP